MLLRGSRDFADRTEYEAFVRQLLVQLNAGRQERLAEEMGVLRPLPRRRLEGCRRLGNSCREMNPAEVVSHGIVNSHPLARSAGEFQSPYGAMGHLAKRRIRIR